MLKEEGCTHVILGHSERRSIFMETDAMINRKSRTVLAMGLIPIVCIGETLGEREAGKTFDVIQSQLDGSLQNFRENNFIAFILFFDNMKIYYFFTRNGEVRDR
jgi:triosephosphate isomerase (TIM)